MSAARAAAPVIEWAGCGVVRTGPRCELGPERKLTLWLPVGALAGWSFATDRGPLAMERPVPVQGGSRLAFAVPAGAREVTVTAPDGGTWSLAVGEAVAHKEVDELLARGKGGDPKAVLGRLRQLADAPDGPRGQAEAAYGRLQLALSDMAAAEPALRRSMGIAREEGRVSDEMRDGSALIWGLVELQQRFGDARAVLAGLAEAGRRYPEGEARFAYATGLLAVPTGDLRAGLDNFRTAARLAERLAIDQLANHADEELARILTMLGRASEAAPILRRLQPETGDACALATLAVNRGWASMETVRGSSARDERVASSLDAARIATQACPDPHRQIMALINAAEYALQTGGDDATRLVTELGHWKEAMDSRAASWRADVLGRWALSRGQAATALASFDEQSAIARSAGLGEETFRADVGAGRALLTLGHRPQATVRFKHAQAELERTLTGIPLAEGQREFLSGHDDAIRYLIDVLVANNSIAEALRVARLTRATQLAYASRLDRLNRLSPAERVRWDEAIESYARIRSALEHEAQEDWKLSRATLEAARSDREVRAEKARGALDRAYALLVPHATVGAEAVPPAAGDVELTFFPGANRWYLFAQTASAVVSRAFAEDRLASTSAAAPVLATINAVLMSARRVRIYAYGKSDGVDWHAVTWQGKPLIASAEVSYGADAGGTGATKPRPHAALIVANPTGDLAAAASEADGVARALPGWEVARLDGRKATRDAVLAALPGATLFHYAGHADVAGPSGAASALRLAGGARAELGDLLAVARAPDLVVLSACEAAGSDAGGGSLLGLAQAFVLSGAQMAVAPTRPVRDSEARAFVNAFYAALAGGDASAVPAAFRRAALDVAAGNAAQSFRLMVP